ncbi:hypothetical protein AURDEDRAFT_165921 [Auricularia subglabra TFB-10046 SS5]|nr:hypothetical protein AURDEDRAFT_165921 [Auricularia subglabra TFB-10046 SS5]
MFANTSRTSSPASRLSRPSLLRPSPRRKPNLALSPSDRLDWADHVALTSCKIAYYRQITGKPKGGTDKDVDWICGPQEVKVTLDDVLSPSWNEVMCTRCGANKRALETWPSKKYPGCRFVKCRPCNVLRPNQVQPPDGHDIYGPFGVYDSRIFQFRSWLA